MVNDAVDRKGAFEDGGAADGGVSVIVDGDASPPALTRGADTVRAPDTSDVILQEGVLGKVVVDDLSAKYVERFPMNRFYSIKERAGPIGSSLVVLDMGIWVEEVVVGREVEMKGVFESVDGDTDRVGVLEAGVGVGVGVDGN